MEQLEKVEKLLKEKGVGILPTDTIYGLAGAALSKLAVERIYRLRKRNLKKPMIILIAGQDDLRLFKIKIDREAKKLLNKFWPGKTSIILPCPNRNFFYLHRGTQKLAFRVPATNWLRNLLKKTGPLIAPSANLEGRPPARTIKEAKKYFGQKIDFYFDKGIIKRKPSIILEVKRW